MSDNDKGRIVLGTVEEMPDGPDLGVPVTALSDLLDGLEEAAKATTPGPWEVDREAIFPPIAVAKTALAETLNRADAACIVAEHNAAPLLVAAIRAVLAEVDELARPVEWPVTHYRDGLRDAADRVRIAVFSALGAES